MTTLPTPVVGPDRRGRRLRDLRISVTDRCNFRCVYCMPREIFGRDFAFLPKSEILTFDEITRYARVAVACGVEKIRLTGGEPLLRRGIEELIAQLAELRTPEGNRVDLALTTNASALAVKATSLKEAGLDRLSVSLDSLDPERFKAINDANFPVSKVLKGIEAAQEAGLGPIKVNMVVKGGTNDQDIVPMARHFKGTGVIVRYIEFMDVGASNDWNLEQVIPSADVVARINEEFPLEPVDPSYSGEVASRWRYRDGSGEIGVISSVTAAFCGTCTRARLSTDGQLFTCLFATKGTDIRALLRDPKTTDEDLAASLGGIWRARDDRYSEIRGAGKPREGRIEMSYIGG